MPWTPKQERLFHAAANNPQIAQRKGISQSKARELLSHSTNKPKTKREALAQALMRRR